MNSKPKPKRQVTEKRLKNIEKRWCDKHWGIAHPIDEEELRKDIQDLVTEIRWLKEEIEILCDL